MPQKTKTKKVGGVKEVTVVKAVKMPTPAKKVKVNYWMALLLTIATVAFLASCVLFAFERERRLELNQAVSSAVWQKDQLIKNEVQTAVSLLQNVYDRAVKGEITFDDAKKQGADLLRNLRYGNNNEGYFWADTTDGTNVVLYGRQDVEGTNRYNNVVNGIYHVQEIIKNGMAEGGGYTDYYYPKMNETNPLMKRAFSLLFKPFNWVVGTGYYIDDLFR